MWKELAPALFLASLANCGSNNHADDRVDQVNGSNGGAAVENATLAKLNLTSDAFTDGGAIPSENTCDGADVSPPLAWSTGSEDVGAYAVVVGTMITNPREITKGFAEAVAGAGR